MKSIWDLWNFVSLYSVEQVNEVVKKSSIETRECITGEYRAALNDYAKVEALAGCLEMAKKAKLAAESALGQDDLAMYIRRSEIENMVAVIMENKLAAWGKSDTEWKKCEAELRKKSDIQEKLWEGNFQTLQKNLQQKIGDLKDTISRQEQIIIGQQQNIGRLNGEISALRDEISTLKALFLQSPSVANSKTSIATNISPLKPQYVDKPTSLSSTSVKAIPSHPINTNPPIVENKVKPHEWHPETPTASVIRLFVIPENQEAFIVGSKDNILRKLEMSTNIDDIIACLSSSPLTPDKTESLRRILFKHKTAIESFLAKLNFDKCDEDEWSETVTEGYFKVFCGALLGNFIIAIYRGLVLRDEEHRIQCEFYEKLLSHINSYLAHSGIYTLNVLPGGKATDENFEDMEPTVKKVSTKEQSGFILEIERLPYRINYVNESGKMEFIQFSGKMLVTAYKAAAGEA